MFLLDGLAVCCKPRQGGHELYRLKEKINLRHVKLIDQPDDHELTGQASTVVHAHSAAATYVYTCIQVACQTNITSMHIPANKIKTMLSSDHWPIWCCTVITGSSRSGPTMNFSWVHFHACCAVHLCKSVVHVWYVC